MIQLYAVYKGLILNSKTQKIEGKMIKMLYYANSNQKRAGLFIPIVNKIDFNTQILFFFLIFIVIQIQLYAFSPHPSTQPQVNPPLSPTSTLPLGFVHV